MNHQVTKNTKDNLGCLGVLCVLVVDLGCGGGRPRGARAMPEAGREVTIYEATGAVVVDRRWVELAEGDNRIALGELAASLEPDSVALRPLGPDDGVSVRERSFDRGMASGAQGALDAAVGKEVDLERAGRRSLRGRLVSVRGDVLVVDIAGARVTVPLGEVVSLGVAGAARPARPRLDARVDAAHPGRQLFEIIYTAGALGFGVSYEIELLAGAAPRVRLRARAHIDNRSGLDMAGARVHLVAGALADNDHPPVRFWSGRLELDRAPGARHLDALATAAALPARFEAVYRGAVADTVNPATEVHHGVASQPRVSRHLIVPLSPGGSLGRVLPAGPAIVLLGGGEGGAVPMRIATSLAERAVAGTDARFPLGIEPDLVGARRQTTAERSLDARRLTESYELVIRNNGITAARVRVVEPLSRSARVTLDASSPPATHDQRARELTWIIDAPPSSDSKLSYTATYRF